MRANRAALIGRFFYSLERSVYMSEGYSVSGIEWLLSYTSGQAAPNIFASSWMYPARDGAMAVFFTWNRAGVPDFRHLDSVRMFITSVPPSEMNVGFWTYGDANPFYNPDDVVFSVDITASAGDGDLYSARLSSTGYYVLFAVQYMGSAHGHTILLSAPKDSRLVNSNERAPSLSYSPVGKAFTMRASMTGLSLLEFYRPDVAFGAPSSISDAETLNEMYCASIVTAYRGRTRPYASPYDGYWYVWSRALERWAPGNYTVGVDFRSPENQTRISAAIDSAIAQINGVLNSYGVSFTRTGSASGDMSIVVDSEYNLFGITPARAGYVFGGDWETHTNGGVNGKRRQPYFS
jgi:hypothetical protein